MSNADLLDLELDGLLDDMQNSGGSRRKAEALYMFPNVSFRVRVDRTEMFEPKDKGDGKNTIGVLYYKYEGEILDVQPRADGQGAGVCTPDQIEKARALIGKTGSCLVQMGNRRVTFFDANDKEIYQQAEQHNAVRAKVERMVNNPEKEKAVNGKSRVNLMQFAFAAARSKEGKEAIPNVFSPALDKEEAKGALTVLNAMIVDAFENRQQVFNGAEVIVETRQYEKKDKSGAVTGFGTVSECLPLPELRG